MDWSKRKGVPRTSKRQTAEMGIKNYSKGQSRFGPAKTISNLSITRLQNDISLSGKGKATTQNYMKIPGNRNGKGSHVIPYDISPYLEADGLRFHGYYDLNKN